MHHILARGVSRGVKGRGGKVLTYRTSIDATSPHRHIATCQDSDIISLISHDISCQRSVSTELSLMAFHPLVRLAPLVLLVCLPCQ